MNERHNLGDLIQSLQEHEAESARQLVGWSLALGRSGASILRHLMDSAILFGSGRALTLLLENIHMGPGQLDLVHLVSKWYEIFVFCTFAVFSLIEVWQAKLAEMRSAGAALR